jgi:2OG-Fe(II) oxygenase superfamily
MPNLLGLFAAFDLEALEMLPANWDREVIDVALDLAQPAELRGGASSSLEPEGTLIRYGLVDGEAVESALPWLGRLYGEIAQDLAPRLTKQEIVTSDKPINGVNINVLRGVGSRYELHVDTNPLTGLLFVTTHPAEDGGQLVYEIEPSPLSYPPRTGVLLLFDATQAPHHVTPLLKDTTRISIPMNFFTPEALASRPPDLDSYLYGPDGA